MSGWFGRELDRQAQERTRDLDIGRLPPMPRGFRPEDVFGGTPADAGYVPIRKAVEELGVSEEEVIFLVRSGKLAAQARGGSLLVLPAITSLLAVRSGHHDDGSTC